MQAKMADRDGGLFFTVFKVDSSASIAAGSSSDECSRFAGLTSATFSNRVTVKYLRVLWVYDVNPPLQI
jgi:hypothetical protein